MTELSQRISNKMYTVDELPAALEALRADGQKVVHCHGVFDLLHIGHIRYFEEAKKLGNVLVVTITPDQHVNKGPSRPVFPGTLRAEAVAALDCVDFVAINDWPTAVECIGIIRPDFYVKGSDYKDSDDDRTGGIIHEENAVRAVGGTIAFTDEITFSASTLINRHIPVFPLETTAFLSDFSSRYPTDNVLKYLEGAKSMKVLVVGETIIDEYLYCETMGKSGKEPILASRHLHTERFGGGIIAVANHVAALSDNVSMLTFLGAKDSQEDFVRQWTNPNVDPIFLYMDGYAPTIVKQRFVESYPFQKLFELYIMDEDAYKPAEVDAFCSKLREILPSYDAVIVLDYGHGMLGPEAIDVLCQESRFLAVNTQINAGNRGFNTVSKYPRADFVCVSENEIRLEIRNRRRDLNDIIYEVSKKLSCANMVVTRGEKGSICFSEDEGLVNVPAFAVNVVDRVGAGDALFSVAALCVAQHAPMEVVGLIGNAVGAEAVSTVANSTSIDRVSLYRHLETLLK